MGATVAVAAALAFLQEQDFTAAPDAARAEALFADLHARVLQELTERANANGWTLGSMACTMIAFAATPHWMAALQIGDGLLITREAGKDYELVFKPDRGEYVNETVFVTSPVSTSQRQVCVQERPLTFICAASDGIERVAVRYQDWTPHTPFFQPLQVYIVGQGNAEAGAHDIAEFLRREKLNARTDDDKSLVLCAYVPDASADTASGGVAG
jgi:hypothetical protein